MSLMINNFPVKSFGPHFPMLCIRVFRAIGGDLTLWSLSESNEVAPHLRSSGSAYEREINQPCHTAAEIKKSLI